MKKLYFPFILLVALFLVGFTGKLPVINQGIYPVKIKNLTYFDLATRDIDWKENFAEVVESKPESLEVEPDYSKWDEVKFGSFKFGNTDQKVWFVMGTDFEGYWTEFYIDSNHDNRITAKEKVKSFESIPGKYKGFKTKGVLSLIAVPVRVPFKGLTGKFEKTLYFFISVTSYLKKDATDTIVDALAASFLEGEAKITVGKNDKLVKFRIIDSNSNGCFNDYGKDQIFMDLNYDGYFKKNESQKLVEFFNIANKQKEQLQMFIPPYPGKIAVGEANQDFDRSQLEPLPDKAVEVEANDSSGPEKDQSGAETETSK
jgi:hypothetical protein